MPAFWTFTPFEWFLGIGCLGLALAAVAAVVTLALLSATRKPRPNLIRCPQCDRLVSRLAPSCPQCGQRFRATDEPLP